MKIFIAADHLGVDIKNKLEEYLIQKNYEVITSKILNSELDDYPDFAFEVGKNVTSNTDALGILICGNGVGMSIAANKVAGVRCVRAVDVDDAYKGKNHNGANVLAIGANLGIEKVKEIVDAFIETEPASLDRYLRRVNKIIDFEKGEYNEL